MATVGNVIVYRDRAAPHEEDIRALRDAVLTLGKSYPEDGVIIMHVTPDTVMWYPDEAARAELIRLIRETNGVLRGVAYCYLGRGVRGQSIRLVVRAVASAIFFAARQRGARFDRDSNFVGGSVSETAAWVGEHSHATAAALEQTWAALEATT